jgi:hypothetical protein
MSAIIFKVLGNEIENKFDTDEDQFGHEPEYKNMNAFMMIMMNMFRNAIGDYQVPFYKYWSETLELNPDKWMVLPQAMVYIIWLWWFFLIIFLPIV